MYLPNSLEAQYTCVCEQYVDNDMAIHVIKVAVLECLGGSNKLPQTGSLITAEVYFLQV